MIEMCNNGAKSTMGRIKQLTSSPAGVFLYSLVTGIVGIIILLGFFSMLLAGQALNVVLPLIVGFNSAASAYGFIDKRGLSVPFKKLSLLAITVLLTVTGCYFISLFNPWEPLLNGWQYLITATAALFSTFLGAWLAVKNINNNRPS